MIPHDEPAQRCLYQVCAAPYDSNVDSRLVIACSHAEAAMTMGDGIAWVSADMPGTELRWEPYMVYAGSAAPVEPEHVGRLRLAALVQAAARSAQDEGIPEATALAELAVSIAGR